MEYPSINPHFFNLNLIPLPKKERLLVKYYIFLIGKVICFKSMNIQMTILKHNRILEITTENFSAIISENNFYDSFII